MSNALSIPFSFNARDSDNWDQVIASGDRQLITGYELLSAMASAWYAGCRAARAGHEEYYQGETVFIWGDLHEALGTMRGLEGYTVVRDLALMVESPLGVLEADTDILSSWENFQDDLVTGGSEDGEV